MAKRSSVSEVHGFVSIKNEDVKESTKRVVKKESPTTNTKVVDSSKQRSSLTNDEPKTKKRDISSTKTKQASNDTKVSRKSSEVSVPKIKGNDSTGNKSSTDVVSVQKTKSKDPRVPNSEILAVPKTKSGELAVSKTKSSISVATKERKSVSRDVTKTKIAPSDPVKKVSRTLINQQSEKSPRSVLKETPKVKSVSTDSSRKERARIVKPVDRKPASTNVLSTSSRTSSINRTSKPSSRENVKKNTEFKSLAIRDESERKRIESKSSVSSKTVIKSNNNIKVSIDSKQKSGTAIEHHESKYKKPSSREKDKVKSTDNADSKPKKESGEEIQVKSSYKELIYFEVDMADVKKSSSNKDRTSVHSARKDKSIKEPATQHTPVSRQGTFTKDDEQQLVTDPIAEDSKKQIQSEDNSTGEVEYEDDFEDYESDFEEYISESGLSSTSEMESHPSSEEHESTDEAPKPLPKLDKKTLEEEKKMDSGNYDLTSKLVIHPSVKQKELNQIREAISRENSAYLEKFPEPVLKVEPKHAPKVAILDFVSALEKETVAKVKTEKRRRSSLILDMIRLYPQEINLFFEVFTDDGVDDMYANKNIAHANTETVVFSKSEQTQTEVIRSENRWTQYPISYHKWDNTIYSFEVYLEDHRGYGGDKVKTNVNDWWKTQYSSENLSNFVEAAAQVVLIMLEEDERWRSDGNSSLMLGKQDHGFSAGYIPIQTSSLEFLINRPICDIVFSPHNSNVFVSSHRVAKDLDSLALFSDQFLGRSILSVWSVLEPSQPLSILVASCQVSAICFDIQYSNLLYAGLTDGSVCLWDLNERGSYHKITVAGSMEHLIRTPTYCSSYLIGDQCHNNVIVSIQSLGYEISKGNLPSDQFSPTQIVTLDADGKIIVWVVVHTISNINSDVVMIEKLDYGITFWGRFKLIASRVLEPTKCLPLSEVTWGLQFLCMSLAPQTTRSILIGTNIGYIAHLFITGQKSNVPLYSSENEFDRMTSVLCIERNSHGFPIFMAGCSNGTVRLYLLNRKRPFKILLMDNEFKETPISKVRWSLVSPGLIFIMDKLLWLHIWDLCKSDYFPQISVSMRKMKATIFDINIHSEMLYLGLAVHKDRLEIHRVKESFLLQDEEMKNTNKRIFKLFVDNCCY